LIGFLIGSFPMLYPWQTIVSTRVNSHGELVPFLKEAVLPWHYAELSVAEQTLGIVEKNPKILFSLILAISAFLVVFLLEKNAKHKQAE
jgi:putative membrane protein